MISLKRRQIVEAVVVRSRAVLAASQAASSQEQPTFVRETPKSSVV